MTSDSSSGSSSGSSDDDDEKIKHKMKKLKKKIKKEQRKAEKSLKRKLKKEKKKRKMLKEKEREREKEKEKEKVESEAEDVQEKTKEKAMNIPIRLMEKSKMMAPMSKEEWEKRQSVVRRVLDEESGRYRLIKGDGEVLEEMVPLKRHKEINQSATQADGAYFQAVLSNAIR